MQLRNSSSRYGLVSMVLHWGVAAVVFGMFALGLWMVGLDYYDTAQGRSGSAQKHWHDAVRDHADSRGLAFAQPATAAIEQLQ